MAEYDKSKYYIDFSDRDTLTTDEKIALEKIQELYKPIERAELLSEYRILGKITDDDYSTTTGIPFSL